MTFDPNSQNTEPTVPPLDNETENPWYKKGWGVVVALGAVAAGAGALYLGIHNSENGDPNHPTPSVTDTYTSPTPDVTNTPEVTPTGSELAFDVNRGIDAEVYKSPEEVARALVDAFNQMTNYGATRENALSAVVGENRGLGPEGYAAQLAQEAVDLYAPVILEPGWDPNNPNDSRTNVVNNLLRGASLTIDINFLTQNLSDTQPLDREPYRRETVFLGMVSSETPDDTTLIVKYKSRESDNSNMNRAGEDLTNGESLDTSTIYVSTVTFHLINGKWYIHDGIAIPEA